MKSKLNYKTNKKHSLKELNLHKKFGVVLLEDTGMVNTSWVKLHSLGELYGLTALENKEDGTSMQVKRELDY